MWAKQEDFTSPLHIYLAIDSKSLVLCFGDLTKLHTSKIWVSLSFLFFFSYTSHYIFSWPLFQKFLQVYHEGLVSKFMIFRKVLFFFLCFFFFFFFSRNNFTIYKITSVALWEVLIVSKLCVCLDFNGNAQTVTLLPAFVVLSWKWMGEKK